MNGFDLARFGGEPERLCCNAEQTRRLVQIEPWLVPVRRRSEYRDLMVRPERGDPLPCPAIAVAGHQSVSVENTGNQVIIGDENQLADGGEDVGRGAVALSAATPRQAQFGMNAANPMDQENDLRRFVIDIGDHLVDDGAHDARLEPRVGRRRRPYSLEIGGEGGDVYWRQKRWLGRRGIVRGNPALDLTDTRERPVPSQLQFRRDQPVLRIDGVVLPECPIGAVACRLEIAHQRVTSLIAATGRLCFGLDGRSYRPRLDNPLPRWRRRHAILRR